MPLFFNGRLHITPVVVSKVDDSAMANRNLTVGNVLALVGKSEGGKPNTALTFANPVEARAALRSGELLTAVEKAFDPSAETPAPSQVVAVRVDPATRSALNLADSLAATVIAIQSTDYGLYTNQIKVKVEAGTTAGKRLTVQLGSDVYTEDDVSRRAFSIQYGGAQASSRMSITNSTLTLEAPNSTVVATIDLNVYNTVQKLVDRINAVASFTATVLDGNGEKPTLNALDSVSNQDVKTALYNARADLQAIVDWFNSAAEGFVTATRQAGAGTLPANIAFTYLAGAVNGTVTSTEWANAFTTLQGVDAQWVVPLTSDASIHAQADAHVQFMSGAGKRERRALVGGAIGQTVDQAIAAAKAINSDRTSQVYPGYYDFDSAGALTLYPPYMTAAVVGAAFAGADPGTPLTNKSLKLRGLEYSVKNPSETDKLIKGGVLVLENTNTGYRVVKSISTWLTNLNYNRVEVSTGVALDRVVREVREALEVLKGERGSPQVLGRAKSIAESRLLELSRPQPQGPGVIVGDDANPAFKDVIASLNGDVLSVAFQCSPVIPVNYIPVTVFAVPFSATVS